MNLQGTEQAGKIHLLLRRNALAPEYQYVVLQVGGMQLQQVLAGEWLCQVEVEYFSAKGTFERANAQACLQRSDYINCGILFSTQYCGHVMRSS
jgi:hypothetical protein